MSASNSSSAGPGPPGLTRAAKRGSADSVGVRIGVNCIRFAVPSSFARSASENGVGLTRIVATLATPTSGPLKMRM